jgi:hypothetical protein
VNRLTDSAYRLLRDMRDHGGNWTWSRRGRSAHGGAVRTLWAMKRLEFVDHDDQLTAAGREELRKEEDRRAAT